tara:strand:+ start:4743 stop:4928 length:186 start_codon:yes stop_codon:yes gene_type:complete
MKQTDFRNFVRHKWFEHVDEVMAWENKPVDYSTKTWYNNNKWFLIHLYKKEGKHDGNDCRL